MEQIKQKVKSFWNWKTKVFVYLILPVILLCSLFLHFRGAQLYDCIMEEYDVGRETQFAPITGSCVISSGKVDHEGNIIWVKVQRDIAIGEFEQ